MDKDSFVFHKSFLDGLPEEDISMWCQHIVQYGLFGKEPEFGNPYMTTVWIKIKNFMDSNTTKWEKKKEANRQWYENKKNRKSSENSENSDFSDNSATLPYTPSVSVSEYVNEYVNESVSVNEYESDLNSPSSGAEEKPTFSQGKITDKYCECYQLLFGSKFEAPSKDFWARISNLIKKQSKRFSDDQICEAIGKAMGDDFAKKNGFDLKVLLSTNMLERYLNPNFKPKVKGQLDTVDPSRTAGWETNEW